MQESVDVMVSVLSEFDFLQECAPDFVRALCLELQGKVLEAGEVIVNAGDEGDSLFFLHRGEATASIAGSQVGEIREGQCFGEMAVLGLSSTRAATVQCSSRCIVWELSRSHLLKALSLYPSERQRFEDMAAIRLGLNERVLNIIQEEEKADRGGYKISGAGGLQRKSVFGLGGLRDPKLFLQREKEKQEAARRPSHARASTLRAVVRASTMFGKALEELDEDAPTALSAQPEMLSRKSTKTPRAFLLRSKTMGVVPTSPRDKEAVTQDAVRGPRKTLTLSTVAAADEGLGAHDEARAYEADSAGLQQHLMRISLGKGALQPQRGSTSSSGGLRSTEASSEGSSQLLLGRIRPKTVENTLPGFGAAERQRLLADLGISSAADGRTQRYDLWSAQSAAMPLSLPANRSLESSYAQTGKELKQGPKVQRRGWAAPTSRFGCVYDRSTRYPRPKLNRVFTYDPVREFSREYTAMQRDKEGDTWDPSQTR